MNKIAFVMPALNEEDAIVQTIHTIPRKQLYNLGYVVDIYVIDGGSVDKTIYLAEAEGAKVIKSEKGYGRQYRYGIPLIDADIIVTGDSDATYPFEDAVDLIKKFRELDVDFMNTNRFVFLDKGSMSFIHKLGNKILSLCVRILFNVDIKDSQSGMWIFKKEIFSKLDLREDGMPFSQEFKIKAFKKFKTAEVPIMYHKRLGKKKLNAIKDGYENFKHLFKMRFRNEI